MRFDFIITLISFLLGKGGFFFVSLVAANLMSTAGYSKYAVIFTVISFISGTVAQAIYVTANRYCCQEKYNAEVYALGIVCALISSVFVYSYCIFYLDSILSYNQIWLLSAISIVCVIYNLHIGWLFSTNKNKFVAISNSLLATITIVASLISSLIQEYAVLLGYLLGYLAVSIFSFRKLNVNMSKISVRNIIYITKKVMFPHFLTTITFVPIMSYFAIELYHIDTSGLEVILYNVSNQIRMIISLLPLVFSALFISKLVTGNMESRLDWILNTSFCTLFTVCIVLLLPLLMQLFSLESSTYSNTSMLYMIYGGLVAAIKSPIARQLVVKELGKFSIVSNLIFAVIYCLVTLLLTYKDGISAYTLSLSYFISQVLHFIFSIPSFIKLEVLDKAWLLDKQFQISLGILSLALIISAYDLSSFYILLLIISYLVHLKLNNPLGKVHEKI
ncbi:hypothetical protein [Aeromonas caviae]|uniref:hypothetical protein n=1 Tax=Aeromonas caviae TaxID=648 RepID=UPI003EC7B7A5